MKRDLLIHDVRQRLKRLPSPYDNHYGVVPLPPPEEGIRLSEVGRRHMQAVAAMAKVDVLASETGDAYLVSRVLTRSEAVSSSSLEGTNSTLDELLSLVKRRRPDQKRGKASTRLRPHSGQVAARSGPSWRRRLLRQPHPEPARCDHRRRS